MNDLELIQKQIEDLQRQAKEITDKIRGPQLEEVREKIKQFGFTAKELGLTDVSSKKASSTDSDKRGKVAVKYRLGDLTWSGRGLKPTWVVKHLEEGGTLEELHV